MTDQDVSDARVAAEIYPIAVKQARGQVLLQISVLVIFVVALVVARFPRNIAWSVGLMTTGAVATVYDLRWWLWLRRADPVEGYRRLQARPKREGGQFRQRLTLGVTIGAFLFWIMVAR